MKLKSYPSRIIFGEYHWTHTAKGAMVLHRGSQEKCRRVHRDRAGAK